MYRTTTDAHRRYSLPARENRLHLNTCTVLRSYVTIRRCLGGPLRRRIVWVRCIVLRHKVISRPVPGQKLWFVGARTIWCGIRRNSLNRNRFLSAWTRRESVDRERHSVLVVVEKSLTLMTPINFLSVSRPTRVLPSLHTSTLQTTTQYNRTAKRAISCHNRQRPSKAAPIPSCDEKKNKKRKEKESAFTNKTLCKGPSKTVVVVVTSGAIVGVSVVRNLVLSLIVLGVVG